MAQTRVNGGVVEGQLLVGSLSHFVIDEVDGVDYLSISNSNARCSRRFTNSG